MKHRSKKPPTKKPPVRKFRFFSSPAIPYIIIAIATFTYFYEIIFSRNFLWEDILYQYYPFHHFLFNNLRQFSIPLWNPYMFAGMPFLADIQTQVFYPLNWVFALFSSSNQSLVFWLVEFKCILHIFLAGIGFYLLARELNLSRYAGITSALTFSLSSFMVMHLIHLTLISTFAWFPLILLFFYRTLFHRRLRDSLLAGICLALANLAGHPQMTLHIVYSLGLLFILYLIFNWRRERVFILKRHLPLFILAIFTGFAIAAAAYLPAYQYSLHTVRELMTYAESAETSLPPSFFISVLIPKFFGSLTASGTDSVQFWANSLSYVYWETAFYFGVVPFVLAILGIVFNRHPLRWHLLILALIALLLALGRFTPFYRLAFEILPGFDRFRIPARFIGILTFAFALFAGLGMDVFLKEKARKRIIIPGISIFAYALLILFLLITGVLAKPFPLLKTTTIFNNALNQTAILFAFLVIALILIYLRNRYFRYAPVFASLLILLTFIDLYKFGHRFNLGTTRPEEFYPRRPFIDNLIRESKETPFRINARSGSYMVLQRNEGLIWQLELLEGYTPLKLTDYVSFEIPNEIKNNLLNVKYRINVDSLAQKIGLVPNPDFLPRAWLADTFIVIPERERILATLADPGFDYRRIVILEKSPEPAPQSNPESTPSGSVVITRRLRERIELKVETARPAILVLSEIYYPEWKALVDSKPCEILRADYCLRALALSAGTHTVIFYYDRTWFNLGVIISLLALAGTTALLLFSQRRTQRLK